MKLDPNENGKRVCEREENRNLFALYIVDKQTQIGMSPVHSAIKQVNMTIDI